MRFLDICKKLSKKIIKKLHHYDASLFEEVKKGFGGDMSMKVDILAEKIFIKELQKYGNIYSEEIGFIDNKKDKTFIIDPIDGSFNISNGFPYYGSSIAVRKNGKIVKSFIVNLAQEIIFTKIKR